MPFRVEGMGPDRLVAKPLFFECLLIDKKCCYTPAHEKAGKTLSPTGTHHLQSQYGDDDVQRGCLCGQREWTSTRARLRERNDVRLGRRLHRHCLQPPLPRGRSLSRLYQQTPEMNYPESRSLVLITQAVFLPSYKADAEFRPPRLTTLS